MKTADLNMGHLGRGVHIEGLDWAIAGTLRHVTHRADEIHEQSLMEEHPTVVLGERYVDLVVGPAHLTVRGDEEASLTG